jgi:hypothetical protein
MFTKMKRCFFVNPLALFSMLALGALSVAQPAAAQCMPPPSGLVAWWPGDGNAGDIVGTNNGILPSGATYAVGMVGEAFSFNASGGYVDVGSNSFFNFGGGSADFTIEAWVQPNNLPSGGFGSIFYRGAPYYGWTFGFYSDGTLAFSGCCYWQVTSASGVIAPGVWSHVAVAEKGQNYSLYCNGALVAYGTGGGWSDAGNPLIFGLWPGGGLLDEVSIYDRALSSQEIAEIYLAGSAGKCKPLIITAEPQSQVGYWGNAAAFSVVASGGTPPYSYQWFKTNSLIGGATNQTLVLTNLQASDAGNYSVLVSDQAGNVVPSQTANLTLNPAGASIALYPGVTISGVVGQTYGIQSSTNLACTNCWLGLTNLTLTASNTLWYDCVPASLTSKFYRVVRGPIPIP